MSSYTVASRAYGATSNHRENFTHSNDSKVFNDLIEKTYKSNGAFGYICVQSPNNEQTVSNWQQDPDLECAWTFISPNLIQRNAEGRVIQAHETNNLKHYVLSRDTSENPVFVGNVGCNEELEQVALPGSQQWSNFSA